MATCDCCHKNEGEVREYETLTTGTSEGDIQKRVPKRTLCDTCNDGQFPYYKPTHDGGEILTCPHDV